MILFMFCVDDAAGLAGKQGLADKQIGEVLASVNAEFRSEGSAGGDNAVSHDSVDSLDLSETQSPPPFDPNEPVTQPGEMANAQLEAERVKQAGKLQRARERRAHS